MQKFNKFDYAIIIVIALLVFGKIGGAFKPIRIVAFIFSPYVLMKLFYGKTTRDQKKVFYFLSFWFIYSLFSLLWTSNLTEGFKELVYYYTHFSLFFLIVFWAQKAKHPFYSIAYGWTALFILTVPIALNEIINGQHLEMSKLQEARTFHYYGEAFRREFASVTFGNKNGYVTVLAYILPFLFSNLLINKKFAKQVFGWTLVAICFFILFTNASRGGVLSVAIIMGVFLFYYRKIKFRYKKGLLSFVALGFSIAIFLYSDLIFSQFINRVTIGGSSLLEDSRRLYLYGLGIELFYNSLFLGTGIGSMASSMDAVSWDIIVLHNLFLEILVQYGIVIFFGFIAFLVKLFLKAKRRRAIPIKFIIYATLFSLPVIGVINSTYLLMPALWVLLASLFTLTTNPNTLLYD